MALNVVVLSHKSLFADGIVSQLRAQAISVSVESLDVGVLKALERYQALAPQVALLDVNDTEVIKGIGLQSLLDLSPATKVVQLDPNSDEIRIYGVASRRARGIGELLEAIQTICAPEKGGFSKAQQQNSETSTPAAQGE